MSTFQIWNYPSTISEKTLAQELVDATRQHSDILRYTSDANRFASVETTQIWMREEVEEGLRRRMLFPFYNKEEMDRLAWIVWYTRKVGETVGWGNRFDTLSMAVRNYRLNWSSLRGSEMILGAESDLLRIYDILGWRVKEILLEVDPKNTAAISCYETVGFTRSVQLGNGKQQMRKSVSR